MEWRKGTFVSQRAIDRLRWVECFVDGEIDRKTLASMLGVSERQATRVIKRYSSEGVSGLNHQSFGKKSNKRTDDLIRNRIMELYSIKYHGFNAKHFSEILHENEGIADVSYSTVKRFLSEVKTGKKKLKNIRHRKKRPRNSKKGVMLQMDGSEHNWVKGKNWCLIAGIDDANSEIPCGEFFETEGLEGYLQVLQRTIEIWGVPNIVYVDHASWLSGTTKENNRGDFKRVCTELGIAVIYANSPQAKGRIERVWGTMQDRLVSEFRLNSIQTIEQANQYLNETFLKKTWNKKFTVEPKESGSALREAPSKEGLREIFSYKFYRKVRNDHTILHGNRMYQIETELGWAIRKKEVEIRIYPDGEMSAYYLGKKLELKLIDRIEDRGLKTTPQPLPMGLRSKIQGLGIENNQSIPRVE
jgi:transposase